MQGTFFQPNRQGLHDFQAAISVSSWLFGNVKSDNLGFCSKFKIDLPEANNVAN